MCWNVWIHCPCWYFLQNIDLTGSQKERHQFCRSLYILNTLSHEIACIYSFFFIIVLKVMTRILIYADNGSMAWGQDRISPGSSHSKDKVRVSVFVLPSSWTNQYYQMAAYRSSIISRNTGWESKYKKGVTLLVLDFFPSECNIPSFTLLILCHRTAEHTWRKC